MLLLMIPPLLPVLPFPSSTGSLPGASNVNRNRYILSQFHPASYLWLEDLVRSLAADYRQKRAPPVLHSREFKYGRLGRSGRGGLAEAGLKEIY